MLGIVFSLSLAPPIVSKVRPKRLKLEEGGINQSFVSSFKQPEARREAKKEDKEKTTQEEP